MLRSVDDWAGENFAFKGASAPQEPTSVAIDHGVDGPTATIPDAHLLFTAQFARAGDNLVLHGEDGRSFVVQDYFATDDRARLLSPEGAALSPDVVAALAGPLAPGQYAQAGTAPTVAQAVGRVAQADSDATIVRNGVAITANPGDPILKGDVLQTVSGRIGVTFNDGSTLNLTANTRLVVNEFVYDPRGSANSQLLDLVQGSLTFISGEIAHTGNMSIGTPVATMGIRGTVGGVTTATDGTVRFYVSQSATGAVILDGQGRVIASVVQDGPMIVVRPAGPLQVLAEEVQKSPAQLALELAALQQILNTKAVGDQLIQQFFQPDPNQQNPSPQSTDKPLTQIQTYQIDLKPNLPFDDGNDDATPPTYIGIVTPIPVDDTDPTFDPAPIFVELPDDLAPLNFAPSQQTTNEDSPLLFSGANAISVYDADTAVLQVTLTATHGSLTLSGIAGLTFGAGDGTGDPTMTFSGTQAAINAALNGMAFTPDANYSGAASVQVTTSDGENSAAQSVAITVNPVNDEPTAVDFLETAIAGAAKDTANIVIILDVSGSMAGTRLAQAKAAIENLLNTTNVTINQVMGVSFSGGANVNTEGSSPWTSAADAKIFFAGLGTGGGTNYVAAIDATKAAWNATAPSSADRTIVYFISDGEPSQALSGADTTAWQNFLTSKGVDVANAIGISTNVNDPDLAPIAWAPENPNLAPIILQNANDLDATLQGTVADVHNIFSDGEVPANVGPDGGRVLSVRVDGVTYTWDGASTITKSGAATGTIAATMFAVDTALGGKFEFHFAAGNGHAAGDWIYTPPEQITQPRDETFHYVLIDNDGDTDAADITVAVQSAVAWTVASEGDNIAFTVDGKAAQLSVDWGDGSDDFNDTDFSHHYAAGTQAALEIMSGTTILGSFNVIVAPDNVPDVDITGTAGSDVLIGSEAAASATYDGGAGDDVLFASGADDTFVFATGGGRDTVIGFDTELDIIDISDFNIPNFDSVAMQAFLESAVDTSHGLLFTQGNDSILLQDVHDVHALTLANLQGSMGV